MTKDLLEPILSSLNSELEIYEISFLNEGSNPTLRVLLQSNHFIGLNELVEVSELLSEKLDNYESEFPDNYNLDVSSAGIERNIRNDHELFKAIGENIKISCYRKFSGHKIHIGELISFNQDYVEIQNNDPENLKIPREYISKINYILIM
ncbi:ribosome maturation factor RimP [Xylocopilactobacillus apis]|uniref:Ribosome maturation factor RimP n=1 Tax=Xylocopilactobacillus apis TaxID=2932183 RepID=A0AAU9DDL7_9LACO|nr:hypothetical protein [Xylocopilactobacillus apis]BDR56251.1 ribosome maturation factor RimP [Xylocopilactobacillus apis]